MGQARHFLPRHARVNRSPLSLLSPLCSAVLASRNRGVWRSRVDTYLFAYLPNAYLIWDASGGSTLGFYISPASYRTGEAEWGRGRGMRSYNNIIADRERQLVPWQSRLFPPIKPPALISISP